MVLIDSHGRRKATLLLFSSLFSLGSTHCECALSASRPLRDILVLLVLDSGGFLSLSSPSLHHSAAFFILSCCVFNPGSYAPPTKRPLVLLFSQNRLAAPCSRHRSDLDFILVLVSRSFHRQSGLTRSYLILVFDIAISVLSLFLNHSGLSIRRLAPTNGCFSQCYQCNAVQWTRTRSHSRHPAAADPVLVHARVLIVPSRPRASMTLPPY
jgi:hypothetical protein